MFRLVDKICKKDIHFSVIDSHELTLHFFRSKLLMDQTKASCFLQSDKYTEMCFVTSLTAAWCLVIQQKLSAYSFQQMSMDISYTCQITGEQRDTTRHRIMSKYSLEFGIYRAAVSTS